MVKSGALCFSGPGLLPGSRPLPLVGSHVVVVTHIQNGGRRAQILAQGVFFPQEKKAQTHQITIVSSKGGTLTQNTLEEHRGVHSKSPGTKKILLSCLKPSEVMG